jgi:site-specific DNA-methyltransferase (adenine-specific)
MIPAFDDIYCGDALQVLRTWPDNFVDLCFTSPPYWHLRDYKVPGQLGVEQTVEAYVERLVAILDEVRRVLKDSGSLYLNLGDGYEDGSLHGIPWRVTLAMKRRKWLLRNDIVWNKINSMPTSATSRFRNAHEYIFLLTKRKRYYFDLDVVRVPHASKTKKQHPTQRPHGTGQRQRGGNFPGHPLGKNPGDVWDYHTENRPKRFIAPGALSPGHFAPFPEQLCERPILASSPAGGVVLDPFMGSGTTAVVARRLGRRFLGIDLSAEYVALAKQRLEAATNRFHRSLRPCFHRATPDQVPEKPSDELSLSSREEAA